MIEERDNREGSGAVEELNALFTAACEAYQQGEFRRAKKVFLVLLEQFADAPILHYNLGLALFEEGDFASATASFSRAASLAEDDADILFNLALARKKQGDITGAIRDFLRLLEEKLPDDGAATEMVVDAFYSLGGCYRQTGEIEQAIACYQRVLSMEKNHLAAHNSLAYLYHREGEKSLAINHYQCVLAQQPDHPGAGYMLAALQNGEGISAPPANYVRDIFDDYAAHFEKSLVDELEYRVPGLLQELCTRLLPPDFVAGRLLDLGCGTGLSGAAFAQMATDITGVDISTKMLAIAEEKGLYSELVVGDIVQFLKKRPLEYSFFLACDVFNYFGELSDVFRVIAASSLPDGYLCFSTESGEQQGFALGETGRFSHNPDYICSLLERYGFTLLAEEKASLRKERGEWVKGTLWLAQCRGE